MVNLFVCLKTLSQLEMLRGAGIIERIWLVAMRSSLKYLSNVFQERLTKICQDNRLLGRDMYPGSPECGARDI
jgi:hypothetical protein